jgi:hypothetical protein
MSFKVNKIDFSIIISKEAVISNFFKIIVYPLTYISSFDVLYTKLILLSNLKSFFNYYWSIVMLEFGGSIEFIFKSSLQSYKNYFSLE